MRQRCDFKKTLFYLEQLILKHNAQANANNVKPVPTGIDFYYAKQQDAKKLVEFISAVLPCKHQCSQVMLIYFFKFKIFLSNSLHMTFGTIFMTTNIHFVWMLSQ